MALPKDTARCTGEEMGTGNACPERAQCERWLTYEHDHEYWGGCRGAWVMIGYSPEWAAAGGCDQRIEPKTNDGAMMGPND